MMGRMSQPLRVIVASVLLATAALGLTVVASDIAITHYLPGDSGVATKHTATFEPAIAGTVVASVAVIALLGHLIVVLRRRAPRWMWLAAAVCTLLGVGAPVIVATLDRPVF
jgi:hypothetical protein